MTTMYPTTRDQYTRPFLLSFSIVTGMLRNLVTSQYFVDTNYQGLMVFDVRNDYRQTHDLIFVPYNSKLGFINSDSYQLVVVVNIRREPIDLFLIKLSVTQQGATAVREALEQYEANKHTRTDHHIRGATVLSLREQLLIMHHMVLLARGRQFFDHRVVTENMNWRYIPLRECIVMSGPSADIEVMYDPSVLTAIGL